MPLDPRINAMINHTEAIIAALDSLSAEAGVQPAGDDPHLAAFLKDLGKRSDDLKDLLEEDVINRLIGLNNLLGPIQHLLQSKT